MVGEEGGYDCLDEGGPTGHTQDTVFPVSKLLISLLNQGSKRKIRRPLMERGDTEILAQVSSQLDAHVLAQGKAPRYMHILGEANSSFQSIHFLARGVSKGLKTPHDCISLVFRGFSEEDQIIHKEEMGQGWAT